MFGTELIRHEKFTELNKITENMSEYFFKACSFEGLALEGRDAGAVMLHCYVSNFDFYMTLIMNGLFFGTSFLKTCFRGVPFDDSCFVDCSFDNCTFTDDNLGIACSFNSTRFINCNFKDNLGGPPENCID